MAQKSRRKPRRSAVELTAEERARNKVYGRRFQTISKRVIERAGGLCEVKSPRCTTIASVTDHRIPWQQGGAKYAMHNLRASCKACNAFRATPQGKEWERSRTPAAADPGMVGSCPHVTKSGEWCWQAGPGGGPLPGRHRSRRWPVEPVLEVIEKYEGRAKADLLRAKLAQERGELGAGAGAVIA
jgi:hypothetical protein